MKLDDNFSEWVALAARRATIRLMDGREATLVSVRKGPRNCKIRLGNRHYLIWIDDIALVATEPETWTLLEAWPAVDLSERPGTVVTSLATAASSRNWLTVVPNPAALHPSFQAAEPPPLPVSTRPGPPPPPPGRAR